MTVDVSVCVPATRADTVRATVRSILGQTYRNWELIVVAQGPNAQAIESAVHAVAPNSNTRVLVDEGRGASRARNAGFRAANGDIIAMTDDDCEPAPDWLETITDLFEGAPEVELIGGAVLAPPPTPGKRGRCPTNHPPAVRYDTRKLGYQSPEGFEWLSANAAIRRSVLDVVGPFDEHLGAGSEYPAAEELDFHHRAIGCGVVMAGEPRAVVQHTYGWRYGIRDRARLQRSYAYGTGAFAGKLELMRYDQAHGFLDWSRDMVRESSRRVNPVALALALRRHYFVMGGYRDCLQRFALDSDGLLRPKGS